MVNLGLTSPGCSFDFFLRISSSSIGSSLFFSWRQNGTNLRAFGLLRRFSRRGGNDSFWWCTACLNDSYWIGSRSG